jgi:hypothetical protein
MHQREKDRKTAQPIKNGRDEKSSHVKDEFGSLRRRNCVLVLISSQKNWNLPIRLDVLEASAKENITLTSPEWRSVTNLDVFIAI